MSSTAVPVLACFLLWLVVMAPFASASTTWLFAGGGGKNTSGSWIVSYGVKADSYVYPKQSPQDDDWVNSLYARQYDGDFFEAGWYWTKTGSTPVWFAQLRKNGFYQPEQHFYVSGVVPGQRKTIAVCKSTGNSDSYYVYVDNGIKFIQYSSGITSSIPCVGTERYDTLDYNKGSWTYVRHFQKIGTSSFQWQYWPSAGVTPVSNQDPSYRFYTNRVNESNHWVYCDDHQN